MDAVVIATPDHWHGKMALDAMDQGKDVYLEKPMVHTNDEARQLVETVKETKRILQVGSQTTSADIWWKAKKAIADGMIGQMMRARAPTTATRTEGEWNWPIEPNAGPDGKGDDYIDWNMWLGIAVQAGPQARLGCRPLLPFPQVLGLFAGHRERPVLSRDRAAEHLLGRAAVPGEGDGDGRHLRVQEAAEEADREVPDTFHLMAEYAKGHSLVLSSLDGERHPHPRHDPRARGHDRSWWTTASSSAWSRSSP